MVPGPGGPPSGSGCAHPDVDAISVHLRVAAPEETGPDMRAPQPCTRHARHTWMAWCPECTAWHLAVEIVRRDAGAPAASGHPPRRSTALDPRPARSPAGPSTDLA